MTAPFLLSSSTFVPVAPEVAHDGILASPLAELFSSRSGMIPPIKETTGQDGPWATAGQTRTVVLADGGTNLETLVALDPPHDYRYRLTDFTGPMKGLVKSVDGRFSTVPEGTGTRVTWSWEMHATNPVSRALLPVLGFFWRRYAAAMWPRFAARL